MKLKKLSSLVLVSSVMFGASGAMADGIATAYLAINDFKFTRPDTTKMLVGTDIIFNSSVINVGDTNASLNGAFDSATGAAPAEAGALDIAHSCVGACTYVENSFAHLVSPAGTPVTGSYSLGDAHLTGASVNFPGLPLPDVDAKTLAETALGAGSHVGSSSGNNLKITTNFSFIASATGVISFSYNADAYVRAYLSSDVNGINAIATIGFTVTVQDTLTGGIVLAHAPLAINAGAARSATLPGQDFTHTQTAAAFADSFGVVAGRGYQITINHVSETDAEVIPEPGSLAILGAGLLSMGLIRRRKRKLS
jgi:PEP-CTERM motif